MKRQHFPIALFLAALLLIMCAASARAADDHGDTPGTATGVTLGSITSGVIDFAGDVDYFSFTVSSTATYFLYSRGSAALSGQLYNASLQLVAADSFSGENNNFKIAASLTPGTYYLRVAHQITLATGPYSLHVDGPGAGTVSDDHGSSPWSATTVALGSVTAGTIDLPKDEDFFKFTVPTTATYFLYSRGSTALSAQLYNASYQSITSDAFSGENSNFKIAASLTPGTYYLKVAHQNSLGTGPYSLHVEGPGAPTVSDDHGSSPWSATTVGLGSATAGAIDLPKDEDFFKFTVPTTATYFLYSRGSSAVSGRLYDATYQFITSDFSSGENSNFKIAISLTPGTYYLKVAHQSTSATGPYTLHVEGPGAPTVTDDHGSSPWSATTVALGSVTAGTIDLPKDEDFFKVTVPTTAIYFLYSRGSTALTAQLYNASYQFVTSDSSSGENSNFKIAISLTPGTYYLRVSHQSTSATGPYTLHVEGPGAPTVTDDHGSSPWSARTVALGSVTAGTIDLPKDEDFFKLTVPTTATYFLYSRGSTGVYGRLYDATYQFITSDFSSGEDSNFKIATSLTPGTYYLKVAHQNTSATGPYTVYVEGPGSPTVTDDHGSSPWSATTVAVGTVTAGTIDLPKDEDFFKFTVSTTATYFLYSRGSTGVYGRLYDATYQFITSDFSSGEDTNFKISVSLTPGTYYLKVAHQNASATGPYTVYVEGPGALTVTDDHGSSPWSATGISGSCHLDGVLDLPRDQDYFRISVPATASYVFYTTGATDTSATLYNSTLQSIANAFSGGVGTNFRMTQTLSPGVYYLDVSGGGTNTTGPYTLYTEIGGQAATAVCQPALPGGVSVSPASGDWTTTPHNLVVGSLSATTIYYQMVNSYNGSTPADPPAPTAASNNGTLVGPSAAFNYYGAAGLLKKSKLRFVGCNSTGCGPVSPVYSYSIDLRVTLEQTPPNRATPGTSCPLSGCATTSTKTVIITHGWNSSAYKGNDWVIEMARDVCAKVGATPDTSNLQPNFKNLICSGGGWDVWVHDWSTRAATDPITAWVRACSEGDHVGAYFKGLPQYRHFHLIAHSAGSKLIDRATSLLKSNGATVHATFLDAFQPGAWPSLTQSGRHISEYGKAADVADNYVDTRPVLGWDGLNLPLDFTDLHLTYGYNVNVTPSYDGCVLLSVAVDMEVCRHNRPFRFYGKSVDENFVGDLNSKSSDPITGDAGTGFNFSAEKGKSLSTLQNVYPDNGECSVGVDNVCHPVVFSPSFLYFLPSAVVDTVVDGATGVIHYVAGTVGTLFNSLNLGSLLLAPPPSIQTLVNVESTAPTEMPSWITVQVTTAAPVNTLRFNWRFAAAGEGLLRIYVDDTPVSELDQRNLPVASLTPEEVYIGGDSSTLPPGTHKIAFRLDGFGTSASGVELTSVELGLTTLSAGGAVPGVLQSAVSRKVHGAAGTFDLPLSLAAATPTTEPRQGPAQTIVFTFDKPITAATATVTEGTATAGAPTFDGNDVIISLTGVINQQYITVALTDVVSADGGTGGTGSVRVGFLLGDVNQNRVVTLSDLGQVNAQVAQQVTAANYLKDVNASGTLSLADKGITNTQLTRSLPAP